MDHLDTRVQYSKSALQKALLKILKNKSIDKVTIKELCEQAKLNRGTFYLHYSTPNDLLKEIEQTFIDENMSYFSPYFHDGYETNQLARMFTCILQNRNVCQVIMGRNGNPKFIDRLRQLMRKGVIEGWRAEFPNYAEEDLDYIYHFLFSGSMQLILNWIEDDHGLSTTDLAWRLDRLGHYCHLAIREF